jgi:threonine synthase
MRYISTRGFAAPTDFLSVLLGGPASDGGLFLPEAWPRWGEADLRALSTRSYAEAAFTLLQPFVAGSFTDEELRADIEAAYGDFAHKDIVPLVEISPGTFVLELFHGPTFAFKDLALQLLGRMFSRALKKLGRRATVLVATSGDTGSAAIAALKGQDNIHVVVLHPKGRVSDVQRRQMTSVPDANVHNVALEGTFDDTQSIVKVLFTDSAFVERVSLTAVNSINFARIAAQCVYYFTAGLKLKKPATFVVPTGNFGDVFAGEAAWRMGLPMKRLVVATNANDIMARALKDGVYSSGQALPTLSPSMDIQVASNFERALFEASNRDAGFVARAMQEFSGTQRLTIPPPVLSELRKRYVAGAADDAETVAAIARIYRESGMIVDPHTGVGAAVAAKVLKADDAPVVLLADFKSLHGYPSGQ